MGRHDLMVFILAKDVTKLSKVLYEDGVSKGFSFFANIDSLKMTSDANALPPPELILRTIAFTFLSFLAFFMACILKC